MRPTRTYFIVGTQRSGTSLLADLLTKTTIAGQPNEYFNHHGGRVVGGRDFSDYGQYVPKIIEETSTPNGVFGAKLMPSDLAEFEQRLQQVPHLRGLSFCDALQEMFGTIRWLYIYRRDRLRQAISYEKASQTGVAHSYTIADGRRTRSAKRTPHYKYYRITRVLAELAYRESLGQTMFSQCQVQPLTLIYEEYSKNLHETLLRVLDYLEIEVPKEMVLPEPGLRKMSDEVTENWVKRYHQDRQVLWKRRLFG